MPIRTPVIIPAFNEEAFIGCTLESLPGNPIEPIVVDNGSQDQTTAVAQRYGVEVVTLDQQGKLPAIQHVLRKLGDRALDPLLILDADTRPLFPVHWHRQMRQLLTSQPVGIPVAVGGPEIYYGKPVVEVIVRSLHQIPVTLRDRLNQSKRIGRCGPNMGISIQNEAALEDILALPHYWPREDKALVSTIMGHSGHYYAPVTPETLVITRRHEGRVPLRQRLRMGYEASMAQASSNYAQRGAPGSIPFELDPTIEAATDSALTRH